MQFLSSGGPTLDAVAPDEVPVLSGGQMLLAPFQISEVRGYVCIISERSCLFGSVMLLPAGIQQVRGL